MSATESWYLSAADRGRRRLFPRGIVALFALAMVLVGWLALPSQQLHERLASAQETDMLTVAYLHAWLNAAPGDFGLQLTLARHQALIGQDRAALESLEKLVKDGPPHIVHAARRLRLSVLEGLAFGMHSNDPRRPALLARVRAELEIIAATLTDPIEIEAMMHRAQALDYPQLVTQLLARLVAVGGGARSVEGTESLELPSGLLRKVEDLARQSIALGDFRLAATLYWRAFDEARTPKRRTELLMLVAKAERAGNRLGEFFVALDSRVDMVELSAQHYKELARLALAANRLDLAERFAKRMLKFSGWWKTLAWADSRMVLQASWHLLASAADKLSPIKSASAQEVPSFGPKFRAIPAATNRLHRRKLSGDLSSSGEVLEPAPAAAFATGPSANSATMSRNPKPRSDIASGEVLHRNVITAPPSFLAIAPERVAPELTATAAEPDIVVAPPLRARTGDNAHHNSTRIVIPAPPDHVFASDLQALTAAYNLAARDPWLLEGLPDDHSESGAPHAPPIADRTEPSTRRVVATADPLHEAPNHAQAINSQHGAAAPAIPITHPLAVTTEEMKITPAAAADTAESTEQVPVVNDVNDTLAPLLASLAARERVAKEPVAQANQLALAIGVLPGSREDSSAPRDQRVSEQAAAADPSSSVISARPATPSVVQIPDPALHAVRLDPARYGRFEEDGGELGGGSRATKVAKVNENLGLLIDTLNNELSKNPYRTSNLRGARPPRERPYLAFDDELYLLAYQVFLANSNLDDAYAVALTAVEQRPHLLAWRIRLAESSQWSQRPSVALQQWSYLAKRYNHVDYWKNVESLASGLRDDETFLSVLRWKLSRRPDDLEVILQVSQTYERLGDPHLSIRWLHEQSSRLGPQKSVALLDEMADVAEKVGDMDLMIQVLRQLTVVQGPDVHRAVRISSALYTRGEIRAAFDTLEQAFELASDRTTYGKKQEEELNYWANYAELARVLQKQPEAIRGYRQLLALGAFDPENLQLMASLLEDHSKSAAAEIMSLGYFRSQDASFAVRAVSLWLQDNRLQTAETFLNQLPRSLRNEISGSVEFLRLRAAYYQQTNQLANASADLLSIYRKEPDDIDNRAAMLWVLLAQRDARRLRAALHNWETQARNEPRLWGPFGASLLALGEPDQALKYFVWRSREQNGYLWWLAYADALDASGRADAAWQLRRRAWTELRKEPLQAIKESPEVRDRIVGLAQQFAPADEAQHLLASLVRDRRVMAQPDQPAPDLRLAMTADVAASAAAGTVLANVLENVVIDLSTANSAPRATAIQYTKAAPSKLETRSMRSAASELAVSYLLSQGNVDSARAWLLSRYANDLTKPLWAELSIALADRDNQKLDHLLATMPDWLPKLDQVEALKRVGRISEAQTLAFDTLSARPDNDSAHEVLVDTMMQGGPSAGITSVSATQGELEYTRHRVDGALRLGQHSKAYLFAETVRNDSNNSLVLANASISGREVGIGLNLTRPDGNWTAEASQHSGLATNTAMRVRWQRILSPMLETTLIAGVNQQATDTAALTVGGQKDHLQGTATLNITGRDYLTGFVDVAKLQTQLGTTVADSKRFSLEYGHRVRIGYPDLTLRTQISSSHYSARNASDPIITRLAPLGASNPLAGFVPASSQQLDVFATFGESISRNYTRALRFFGEAGLSYNSVSGGGYSLRGGLSTSIFGMDRLTLFGAFSGQSPGNAKGSHEVGLTYRLHY